MHAVSHAGASTPCTEADSEDPSLDSDAAASSPGQDAQLPSGMAATLAMRLRAQVGRWWGCRELREPAGKRAHSDCRESPPA